MSRIKKELLSRVKNVALGNSDRGLKEVAADLLNAEGKGQLKNICEGTFLHASTVLRVMECPEDYKPQADTLERIFKYCNAKVTFEEVRIQKRYMNQPKREEDQDDEGNK